MLSESLFPHLQLEDKNICPTYFMDRESGVEIYVKPPKKLWNTNIQYYY